MYYDGIFDLSIEFLRRLPEKNRNRASALKWVTHNMASSHKLIRARRLMGFLENAGADVDS